MQLFYGSQLDVKKMHFIIVVTEAAKELKKECNLFTDGIAVKLNHLYNKVPPMQVEHIYLKDAL